MTPDPVLLMKSVLDIEVGYAHRIDLTYTTVNLLAFLTDITHTDQVHRIRSIEDKKERDEWKKQLPVITPSGIFKGQRTKDNLIRHTGMMVMDIDGKDNPQYTDFADLRDAFAKNESVAYAGLSASGRGCFLLIPIRYPKHHAAYFLRMEAYFAAHGVTVDPSGKDITRPRFYSYDPNAKFRHDARPLEDWTPPPKRSTQKKVTRPSGSGDTWNQVNRLTQLIEARKIDLTIGYDNWLKIGFALAGEFREDGRDLFHRISSIYHRYDPGEADRQYTNCLNSRGEGIHIGSLFHLAKDAGIHIAHKTTPPARKATSYGPTRKPPPPAPVIRREVLYLDRLTYLSETKREAFTIVTVKDADRRTLNIIFNLDTGEPADTLPEWTNEYRNDWKQATLDGKPCFLTIAANSAEIVQKVPDQIIMAAGPDMPVISPKPAKEWQPRIEALEKLFSSVPLPATFHLNQCSIIRDLPIFIASHLAAAKAMNRINAAAPYLERLEDLAARISG